MLAIGLQVVLKKIMIKNTGSFRIRSKVWIENDAGEVVFGLGRLRIFEAIARLGSIHAAARELGMGYKAMWNRIRATEERLGIPLLVRNTGGASGGGSELTETARALVAQFREIQRVVETGSDECFEKQFVPLFRNIPANPDETE